MVICAGGVVFCVVVPQLTRARISRIAKLPSTRRISFVMVFSSGCTMGRLNAVKLPIAFTLPDVLIERAYI